MLSAPIGSTPKTRQSGLQLLDRAGDAGDQPAAADRHDDRVEIAAPAPAIRAPSVAVPRAVRGPSNGWTNARPSLGLDPLRRSRTPAATSGDDDHLAAVAARPLATRAGLAVASITSFALSAQLPRRPGGGDGVVAGAHRGDAARQRLRRQVEHHRPGRRAALNEPVCWNSSSLRLTRVPACQPGAQLRAVPVQHRRAHDPAGAAVDAVARISASVGPRWHHRSRPDWLPRSR